MPNGPKGEVRALLAPANKLTLPMLSNPRPSPKPKPNQGQRQRARQEEGKGRSQCWGTNYRAAPEILHGYTESWKNKKSHEMSTEERLDLRCGGKADKFCK